jgi:glycosyltransferase involved in cell wall biosynthesis
VFVAEGGYSRSADTAADLPSIKVLYLIGTLEIGGSERQLVQLATSLDRTRFAPVVFCLSSAGPLERDLVAHGIQVRVLGLRNMRSFPQNLLAVVRLARLIARERPAIVHGFLFWAYVLGALCAALARVPVVIASRRSLGNFKSGRWHYLMLERLANRFTDLIIANSHAVRHDVLLQERLPPHKVIVIHNGVAIPSDPSPESEVSRRLGFGEDVLTVGVVANLIRYKGHDVYLRAWALVIDQVPHARTLLIGEGPMRAEIERSVAELDLGSSVLLLGSRSDVPRLLAAVDLVVHPSLQEGFSNAILEAMAAGKAVVATAVGGNSEAVVDGVTGSLVPAGDAEALAAAVIRLLEDPTERSRLGSAGRSRVLEQFSVDAVVQRYQATYEALIRQTRGIEASVKEVR